VTDTGALELLIDVNRSRSAAAGLDVFLYDHLTKGVSSFEEYRARFERQARSFAERGAEAVVKGRGQTACDAFETAWRCYHYATCVPGSTRGEIAALLQRAADAHKAALAAAKRPYVRFEAEDTGGLFCGLLERPAVDGHGTPAVIVVPGLDSSKEEFDRVATTIRMRGLATLRIDGPGQGEMLTRSRPLADYERVITAAIDALKGLPDIDTDRIGAIGLSLGGYYVSRAIAHEPRVRAAVAVTGPYEFPPWSSIPPLLREILSLRCDGEREAEEFSARVDLSRVAARIGQPLLVVVGDADPVVSAADARRLADEAPRAELVELVGGDHLGANRRWEWEPRVADWLTEQL